MLCSDRILCFSRESGSEAKRRLGAVAATQIHLVRHGEVYNPEGILYGRLPGYHLSELGRRMAGAAAAQLAGHPIVALYASPLQRAQESAKPWAEGFGLEINTDERLIEPFNKFEGSTFEFGAAVLSRPRVWPWVLNPFKPSWGEPYASVVTRMLSAIEEAWSSVDGGEIVMVSHQMPIVMVQRSVAGQKLFHDPRKRHCRLSSITTLEKRGERFVQVDYQDPAADLLAQSIDLGAV
jgi:broad specificity phosphatase PhoE